MREDQLFFKRLFMSSYDVPWGYCERIQEVCTDFVFMPFVVLVQCGDKIFFLIFLLTVLICIIIRFCKAVSLINMQVQAQNQSVISADLPNNVKHLSL